MTAAVSSLTLPALMESDSDCNGARHWCWRSSGRGHWREARMTDAEWRGRDTGGWWHGGLPEGEEPLYLSVGVL